MGSYYGVADYDNAFKHVDSETTVIVNDLDTTTEEQRQMVNDTIYTVHEGDVMSVVPRCKCKEKSGTGLRGTYNLGVVCEVCKHPVAYVEEDITAKLWVKRPEGLEKIIHPLFLSMLRHQLKRGAFDIVHWMADSRYVEPTDKPEVVLELERFMAENGIQRTYNHFVQNYKRLVYFVRNYRRKKPIYDELEQFMEQFEPLLFVEQIPLTNRSLLILESTSLGGFAEKTTPMAVDATQMFVGIDLRYRMDNPVRNTSILRLKQDRFFRGMIKLTNYYREYQEESLFKKHGMIRKHEVGTRVGFCARCVISSITDAHDINQIVIPWSIGTVVFRFHLINKLSRMGYTYNQQIELLTEYATRYHPVLDMLFREILSEYRNGKGAPITFHRNPTLERGSAQQLTIGGVNTDVDDNTIHMSIEIVRGFNADYDGEKASPSLNTPNCGEELLSTDYHLWVEIYHNTCRVMIHTSMVKTSVIGSIDAPKHLSSKEYGVWPTTIESYSPCDLMTLM